MTIRPRWHIAVHEAAHAVATVALGGTVTQVSVRRAGLTGGRCWSDTRELPPLDQAAVSLAGPCAALFITEGEPDAEHRNAVIDSGGILDDQEGDWSHARALADQHGFSYDDAVERAALLVLDHWPAIQAVARALRGSHRGLVSGDRVTEIVAAVPRCGREDLAARAGADTARAATYLTLGTSPRATRRLGTSAGSSSPWPASIRPALVRKARIHVE